MLHNYYENDTLLFVHRVDKHPTSEKIGHDPTRYILMYLISGEVTYNIGGKIYMPKPRDLMLFHPKRPYQVEINPNKPYERINIQFKPGYIESEKTSFDSFSDIGFGIFNIIRSGDFKNENWDDGLKAIMETKSDFSPIILSNVNLLLEELKNKVKDSDKNSDSGLHKDITDYIDSSITEQLSLDGIAEKFHISRSKLSTLFRKKLNCSVLGYITAKRLNMAKELIENGAKPTEIYTRCGFRDYTTFYRAYKSKLGVSPKENKKSL